jgi:Meiotically up-regulated gene 113
MWICMPSKQDIINEILRTAKENAGKPLGEQRFKSETGITSHELEKYWRNFGDALVEAGFERNILTQPYDSDYLISQLLRLTRKLGRFPTLRDIKVEHYSNPEYPADGPFRRLGNQKQNLVKLVEFCKERKDCADVYALCLPLIKETAVEQDRDYDHQHQAPGEVYLYRTGQFHKIGKTNDTVRRGKELRIQLPEKLYLIHSIKTDDPSGVEAYWKKRFKDKQQNDGEFFKLTSSDVRAFKRWRHIW